MADIQSYYTLTPNSHCRNITAVAGRVYTIAVPDGAVACRSSGTGHIWATTDGTNPVVPSGVSTTATRSPLMPKEMWIGGATELRIVSQANQMIQIEFRTRENL